MIAVGFSLMFGSILLGNLVTPFHYADALAIIAVALPPALLVLLCFTAQDGTMLLSVSAGRPMKTVNRFAGLAFLLIVLPGNYVLYANQALDRSAAVEETVPVTRTWVRVGRHGHSYMVNVTPNVGSPLRGWSFYGAQPVRLSQAAYKRATAGVSALVLREHRGAFGFAWYEPTPTLLP